MIENGERKTFEKQVLRIGKWKHASAPGGVLNITRDFIQRVADNFKRNPFVPVYRGHISDSKAAENPDLIITKNIAGFEVKEDGLYAKLQVDESELDKYADVSLGLDNDYEDHETGQNIGPTARHLAFVPSPYIKGLNGFTPLSEQNYSILLSEISMADETKTPVEEVVVEAPVEETETVVEAPVDATEDESSKESETQAEAEVEETKVEDKVEEEKEETSEDIKVQLADIQAENARLRRELSSKSAETLFSKLLNEGKVLPAFKEEFVQLAQAESQTIELSDGSTKSVGVLLGELFSKMPTLVNLKEKGINIEGKEKTSIGLSESFVEDRRKTFFALKENKGKTEADFQEYLEKNKDVLQRNDTN